MAVRRTLRSEPEQALLERTLARLKAAGWKTSHRSDSRMIVNRAGRFELVADPECAGFPDILACHPQTGRIVAIECKARGKKPRANQVEWLSVLFLCGAETWVMDPDNEAEVMGAVLGREPVGV